VKGGGGPPVMQVGPSCEAAGRGAVVLGRNKEACMADENAALTTLKQNWSKYVASDKTLCIGMWNYCLVSRSIGTRATSKVPIR
jgi:hypothetical protein